MLWLPACSIDKAPLCNVSVVDIHAMADDLVQQSKDALPQQMIVPLRECHPSAVAKAMSGASKSKEETLMGRLTKQLETKHTTGSRAETQLDDESQRDGEIELDNEKIKR